MRILVINVHFSPESYGGATVVAEAVARGLMARGAEVTALAAMSRPDLPPFGLLRAESAGLPVWFVNLPTGHDEGGHDVARQVRRVARQVAPDLAHVHCVQGLGAGLIPALADDGIPVILSTHDYWWLCAGQFMARPDGRDCGGCGRCVDGRQALWAAAARADCVTYPSRFSQARHAAAGFLPGRGVLWENGVRPPGPDYAEMRAARRAADPRLVFGYVGGPSAIKGWPLVRAAFSGPGPTAFRGVLADASPDGRWWPGGVPAGLRGDWRVARRYGPEGMDAFYAGIDVLLFPSQWAETFGLTIREALARGVRVIQTQHGGTVEHGGTTRLLPQGAGADDLRAAIAAELAVGPQDEEPVAVRSEAEQAAAFLTLAGSVIAARRAGRHAA